MFSDRLTQLFWRPHSLLSRASRQMAPTSTPQQLYDATPMRLHACSETLPMSESANTKFVTRSPDLFEYSSWFSSTHHAVFTVQLFIVRGYVFEGLRVFLEEFQRTVMSAYEAISYHGNDVPLHLYPRR